MKDDFDQSIVNLESNLNKNPTYRFSFLRFMTVFLFKILGG